MCGGMIVDASWSFGSGIYGGSYGLLYLHIDNVVEPLYVIAGSNNLPLQSFTPIESMDYPFGVSTNLRTYQSQWHVVSLKNKPGEGMININPDGNNVMIINCILNTAWTTTPNTSMNAKIQIEEYNWIGLYNSDKSQLKIVEPEIIITKVPVVDKTTINWYYSTFYYISVKFDIPYEYLYPGNTGSNIIYNNMEDIPIFQFLNSDYATYGIGLEYYISLTKTEDTNMLLYQNKVILNSISNMQNAIVNAINQSGSVSDGAVVTAVNNNAQTVAQQVLNSGKSIVTAVNEVTGQIFEYDIGEIPGEVMQQIAQQDEKINEVIEEYENAKIIALDLYEPVRDSILESVAHDFYIYIIQPIYMAVLNDKYAGVLVGGVIMLIMIVAVLKR
jgi:hypothetical protein